MLCGAVRKGRKWGARDRRAVRRGGGGLEVFGHVCEVSRRGAEVASSLFVIVVPRNICEGGIARATSSGKESCGVGRLVPAISLLCVI